MQQLAVLRLAFLLIHAMRGSHLDAVVHQIVVQRITVMRVAAGQVLRLGFNHVDVETQLHQLHFMMVRSVRADRQWQPLAIHNRHDFYIFAALGRGDFLFAAFGLGKRHVDEALRFFQVAPFRSVLAKSDKTTRNISLRHHC